MLIQEPARAVPLAAWVGYVTIVFFSNGILPGPDATQLDGATWVEVRDLSLNFWLVAPLLNLPFAPTVHPGLEAIFNWLLAWAAAFGGFLSDGRPGRSAGTTSNSMLPVLAGMQFLTNAVLLPYLVRRGYWRSCDHRRVEAAGPHPRRCGHCCYRVGSVRAA
mmetsp:Transcript_8896/g.19705  ORF Transcript_8896/g.19705 Transcript_8896/m.19705 type:complete len:162 (+) Transcript_8896:2-487(+)